MQIIIVASLIVIAEKLIVGFYNITLIMLLKNKYIQACNNNTICRENNHLRFHFNTINKRKL